MNKSYIPALCSVILLAFLYYIGNKYYLFVRTTWFDIVMHLLGGMAIALSVYWFLKTVLRDKLLDAHLWVILLVTLIVGILWEGFEWYYDIAGGPLGSIKYYNDSVKDLFNDTLGAFIIYLFLKK